MEQNAIAVILKKKKSVCIHLSDARLLKNTVIELTSVSYFFRLRPSALPSSKKKEEEVVQNPRELLTVRNIV